MGHCFLCFGWKRRGGGIRGDGSENENKPAAKESSKKQVEYTCMHERDATFRIFAHLTTVYPARERKRDKKARPETQLVLWDLGRRKDDSFFSPVLYPPLWCKPQFRLLSLQQNKKNEGKKLWEKRENNWNESKVCSLSLSLSLSHWLRVREIESENGAGDQMLFWLCVRNREER